MTRNRRLLQIVAAALLVLAEIPGLMSSRHAFSADEAAPSLSAISDVTGLPIEFQPYRLSVEIVPADPATSSERAAAELRHSLPLLIDRAIGSRWHIVWIASAAQSSQPSGPEAESQPTGIEKSKELATPSSPRPVDTAYQIAIERNANRTIVRVNADEPLWQHRSPVLTVHVADARELPTAVVTLMARLFRPQALWERLDDTRVRLRIQAAGLGEPDPEFPLLNETECFVTGILHLNRDGSLRAASQIPWTLVSLTSAIDGRGTASVISGLRQPLSSRPRGRIELRAVASRAQWNSTILELTSQTVPPRQLVAHEVIVRPQIDASASEVEPIEPDVEHDKLPASQQRLLSDRLGQVVIGEQPDSPVVWVTVMSGDQRLAEVPIVPGAVERLKLELKDDQLRLRVEGQLKLLQSDLIAVVAERAALMLSCRGAAKKTAWKNVDSYLKQLQSLPTAERFEERITGIRVPAVATARQQKDTLAERRIQRQCDDLEAMLKQHLAADKLQLLREEMARTESGSGRDSVSTKLRRGQSAG